MIEETPEQEAIRRQRIYQERMAKAQKIQDTGTAFMQFGCMLMFLILFVGFFLIVAIGALAS